MAKSLVIVESPAKAKTIQKYLGKDYEVMASKGHIKDLPKRGGVDLTRAVVDSQSVRAVKGGRTRGPTPRTAANAGANATC